jgi:hypothetical protein
MSRSIGQCSIRSAGHGRTGLASAGPAFITVIITSVTADAV